MKLENGNDSLKFRKIKTMQNMSERFRLNVASFQKNSIT